MNFTCFIYISVFEIQAQKIQQNKKNKLTVLLRIGKGGIYNFTYIYKNIKLSDKLSLNFCWSTFQ